MSQNDTHPRRRAEHNPHFFDRQPNGSVRLRISLSDQEASLIEEAAGTTPLMVWMHRALGEAARRQVREARAARAVQPPPPPEDDDA